MKIYIISIHLEGPDFIVVAFKSIEDANQYIDDHYAKNERVFIHETILN